MLPTFKITYLVNNKPVERPPQEAEDGFQAECDFYKWADKNLDSPVRVVRVERVQL